MRKKLFIYLIRVAVVLLLAPLSIAHAQRDKEALLADSANNRVIKVYPVQLGEAQVAFEMMHTHRKSVVFGVSYVYSSYLKGEERIPDRKDVQGFAFRLSQRRYTGENEGRPYGFFHGPLFGYRLLSFGEDAFGLPAQELQSRKIGRLNQHSLDLSYQLGVQFKIVHRLSADVAAAVGGRVKYAAANNAGDLITDRIIGHVITAENNSATFAVPLPQLNVSVGYAF